MNEISDRLQVILLVNFVVFKVVPFLFQEKCNEGLKVLKVLFAE